MQLDRDGVLAGLQHIGWHGEFFLSGSAQLRAAIDHVPVFAVIGNGELLVVEAGYTLTIDIDHRGVIKDQRPG